MLALLVLLVVFALDFVFVLLVLHAVVMLTNIYLQNLASIQKRTSFVKFAHLAEKSGKGSISNLSTKVPGHWRLGPQQPEERCGTRRRGFEGRSPS